jgi:adenylate cyclase
VVLIDMQCDLSDVDPFFFLKASMLSGMLAGLIGGSCLVFIWEKQLRGKNYGVALLQILLGYSLVYTIVAFFNNLLILSQKTGLAMYESSILIKTAKQILSINQLQGYITWLIIVLGTLIALQVSDKYGPGVFSAFLLGRYFNPKREERIFMFLDLRSSTTIAEHLGEVRYFNFINQVFKDVTPAILATRGEIYQYVGDEIVISWKMRDGIQNANCIACYFKVQSTLNQQYVKYRSQYDGIEPVFKAGLHYGHVMAGEVGVVKRDIAYSGDVLNTTARIQSKCNEFGVNILCSKYLLDKLNLGLSDFRTQLLGEIPLRGKQEKVKICSISS